jgi:hypothetical protein
VLLAKLKMLDAVHRERSLLFAVTLIRSSCSTVVLWIAGSGIDMGPN